VAKLENDVGGGAKMRSTIMARVPRNFWDEVESIAKERNQKKTEFLRKDGAHLLKNAKIINRLLGRFG